MINLFLRLRFLLQKIAGTSYFLERQNVWLQPMIAFSNPLQFALPSPVHSLSSVNDPAIFFF
jgi:hypothetical protein